MPTGTQPLAVLCAAAVLGCATAQTSAVEPSPATKDGTPPHRASPPTGADWLAAVQLPTAALDPRTGWLFLSREGGIDVADVRTGKTLHRIELGAGTAHPLLWPAGPYLVARRPSEGMSAELVVVDPAAPKRLAECALAVDAPKASSLVVEPFGLGEGIFIHWEALPPQDPPRGAMMTDQQMADWHRRFTEAYRCGFSALTVSSSGTCELRAVQPADLGLEGCDSTALPLRRAMPATFEDVVLKRDTQQRRQPHGWLETSDELVVLDQDGRELWRRELARDVVAPPPP